MIAILYINTKFTKNAASKRVKTMPKPEKQPRNEKKEPELYCSSRKSYYICDREIMFNA